MFRYPVLVYCLASLLIVPYNGFAASATSQSAINTGTKVAAAAINTVVDATCQEKFFGCMDTFCMQDNMSGGRCQCSNKVFALDKRLAQLDEIDLQTQLLSAGAITALETDANKKSTVDLSLWTKNESDDDDIETTNAPGDLGDALLMSATELCMTRIPECEKNANMIQLLYTQQIKSDCIAYENSIKSAENTANGKLASVQSEIRNTAYNKLKSENKYSLGECVAEYKKCMQTTAGCGNDFANCAALSTLDMDNTYTISGEISKIDIAASTYEILDAKRPLCDSVLSQCTSVSDQVWDAFLRANAPQIRNAELIAENKNRSDCIGNIATCFQNACRDQFDPDNTDGSYDLCLTRPETMLSLCEHQLNACGVNTTDNKSASQSPVWQYVVAKLASMRVDSCTTAVRECLTSADRCGSDYSQCVGMETDAIIRMCPYDKLSSCQKIYGTEEIRGDDIYDELSTMVTGLMVNIDNGLLATCQNALNESMLRICGSTTDCNAAIVDKNLGATSLEYKLCEYAPPQFSRATTFNNCHTSVFDISDEELGRVVENPTVDHIAPFMAHIDGVIFWDSVILDENGLLPSLTAYLEDIGAPDATPDERNNIKQTLDAIKHQIDSVVFQVESDPTVQFCMTGREIPGVSPDNQLTNARFPNYTQNARMIIGNQIIKTARDNYNKRYNEMTEQMLRDYQDITERQLAIKAANNQDARRESARQACVAFASMALMPASPRKGKAKYTDSKTTDLTGYYHVRDFSYQETATTEFNPETFICTKCVKQQQCLKARNPIFGKKTCTNWGTETENCTEYQF